MIQFNYEDDQGTDWFTAGQAHNLADKPSQRLQLEASRRGWETSPEDPSTPQVEPEIDSDRVEELEENWQLTEGTPSESERAIFRIQGDEHANNPSVGVRCIEQYIRLISGG